MVYSEVFMFLDETGTDEESNILAICCIITHDPNYIRLELDNFKQKILRDPVLKSLPSIKKLSKNSFHYCEDHQEVKPDLIKLMIELPFQAYICYQSKGIHFAPSDGYDWYDRLFGRLMFDRLRANKDAKITIFYEQHDNRVEHRRKELEDIVQKLVKQIRFKDGVEFALVPDVLSTGKSENCLVLADYVAAIFKDYMLFGRDNPTSWQARNFNRISPKIRVIHDYSSDTFFTRRNPFL